jgi:hypothetical protein
LFVTGPTKNWFLGTKHNKHHKLSDSFEEKVKGKKKVLGTKEKSADNKAINDPMVHKISNSSDFFKVKEGENMAKRVSMKQTMILRYKLEINNSSNSLKEKEAEVKPFYYKV